MTGPRERLAAEPDPRGSLRRAAALTAGRRRTLALTGLASLAATAAILAGPVFVGRAVDAVIAVDRAALGAAVTGFGAATAAAFVLEQVRRRMAARAGEELLAELRTTTATRLLARPLDFFDRHPAGELHARATTDIDALSRFVHDGLPELVDAVVLLAVTVVVLTATAWPLAAVTVLYLPGFVLAERRFRREGTPAYAALADAQAATVVAAGETLAARELLDGVGAADAWRARLAAGEARLETCVDDVLRADNRLSVLGLWQQLTLAGVVLAGGALVARGLASVGDVATGALVLRQLFAPLDALTWLHGDARRSRANLARILALVDGALDRPDPAGALAGEEAGGPAVALRAVRYGYVAQEPVLHDVSLTIGAGERVALVGPTGSGKSTLAKVVAGLYRPDAGTVRVGGRTPLPGRDVVLVPQENHLLDGTLADNLRLAPGHHSDDDLLEAFEASGLRPWLDGLPGGLGSAVAAGGTNLSAGERQLVALARAALVGPPVLILDEATADVDPATEALVTTALDRIAGGRTVVVVAHRPATAARCDRAVRLVAGRIAPPTRASPPALT